MPYGHPRFTSEEEGASVVIMDIFQERLNETEAGIEIGYGVEVLDLLVDGADEEKVIDAGNIS